MTKAKRIAQSIDESSPMENLLEELGEEVGEDYYARFIYNNVEKIENSPSCELKLHCQESIPESFVKVKWESQCSQFSFCINCVRDYVMEEKDLASIVTEL